MHRAALSRWGVRWGVSRGCTTGSLRITFYNGPEIRVLVPTRPIRFYGQWSADVITWVTEFDSSGV